jgi:GABA permease
LSHVLVIANETAASRTLLDALRHLDPADCRITVVAPVNEPNQGYVVYEDTRRASAGRRMERTLGALREAGFSAQGFVVDTGPVQAAKDALAQLEPEVDRIVVSTHGAERSGWMRRNVVEDIERAAHGVPVQHVTVEQDPDENTNVLVIANRTVLSDELLERIRKRAKQGNAAFLIVAPQGDGEEHADADRRLRRALTELRGEGVNAHGQIVHPDPYTAAMNAVHDERVDEIIVSTFPGEKSGWLRRDLVGRLRKDTGLPVDHVISANNPVAEHV